MHKGGIDKTFFGIVLTLVIVGAIMFTSASLGILAKNPDKFYNVILNQFIFGIVGGLVALYFGLKIPYKFWRSYSLVLFILSVLITLAVFVPGIGAPLKSGAKRWIEVFGVSLQPVEFLKVGFIIYFAALLSLAKNKVQQFRYSFLPFIILLGLISVILLNQPDTKNVLLITVTAFVMLFVSGVSWKKIAGLFIIIAIALGVLVFFKPYLMNRINTFLNPNQDAQGTSYQLQQSLIAVGSGGIFGRGLGQSIQKFNYLPEPQGDSIFAVIGEELGFLGGVLLIILYIIFAVRGYRIAIHSPDSFSKLLVIGFVTIIIAQSFMNIASIIGVFPLTGVPLVFISHGGTSLFLSLGMIGIILNISKNQKKIA
jgi:cell division protein FtsW